MQNPHSNKVRAALHLCNATARKICNGNLRTTVVKDGKPITRRKVQAPDTPDHARLPPETQDAVPNIWSFELQSANSDAVVAHCGDCT